MTENLVNTLAHHLTRDQIMPRRVALYDDTFCELVNAPSGSTECMILSRIVEIIRQAQGEPIYSRHVVTLLEECLYADDEQGWQYLCDDIACRLFDDEGVRGLFAAKPNLAKQFVRCVQGSKTMIHAAAIIRVLARCIPLFEADARQAFVQSLQHGQGLTVITSYAHVAKALPGASRRLAHESFGQLLIHDDSVFDAIFETVFDEAHCPVMEDILSILIASPQCVTRVHPHPDRASILLHHASRIPPPRRASILTMLAYLCPGTPSSTEAHTLAEQTVRLCHEDSVVQAAAQVLLATGASGASQALATYLVNTFKK